MDGRKPAPVATATKPPPAGKVKPGQVHVTGIDIPFMDLLLFLVKLTLAAIPAVLIATAYVVLAVLFFGGIGGMFTR
jgi:hypothetical protein